METLRWPNNYEFFFKRGRESMLIRRWLNENMIGSEGPEVPSNRQMVRYERIYIYIMSWIKNFLHIEENVMKAKK